MMGGGGDRRRGWSEGRYRGGSPFSEINVTPFVDVMLVLLVVFMITAPLLTVGVEVDLPRTQAAPVTGSDEPVSVSVAGDGRVFIQETEIELENLGARLMAIGEANSDLRVFVRGDQGVPYGRVMQAVSAIHAAGFRRVALITDPTRDAEAADPGALPTDRTGDGAP